MWILDDISPLRQLTDDIMAETVHLFEPEPAYRITRQAYGLNSLNAAYFSYAANNPPSGIIVQYYLKDRINSPVTLELLDANANVIQHFSSEKPENPAPHRSDHIAITCVADQSR